MFASFEGVFMARLTKEGWFGRAPGSVFPMPLSWQGWGVVVAFIILIALTARLDGEPALILRAGLIAAFLAVGFFTYDPE
jgi:hypothetical protein